MRWKSALNAFAVTFDDRFPAGETYQPNRPPRCFRHAVDLATACTTTVLCLQKCDPRQHKGDRKLHL